MRKNLYQITKFLSGVLMAVFLFWFARITVDAAFQLTTTQLTVFVMFQIAMAVGIIECWRKAK